jgi:hypothetical protein
MYIMIQAAGSPGVETPFPLGVEGRLLNAEPLWMLQ